MTARRSLEWSDGAAGPALKPAVWRTHDWRLRAACTPEDDAVMFPPPGAGEAVRKAKAICHPCLVRGECLRYALANPLISEHGIWDGLTVNERKEQRRPRPVPAPIAAGLPRKQCCRCQRHKLPGEFYRRSDSPDGRQSRCIECEGADRAKKAVAHTGKVAA